MNKKFDKECIKRCIELAEKSVDAGEAPFGCVITKDGKIIAESGNGNKRYQDVASHAEILAMRKLQKLLNTDNLSGYTLYSNCEPCPMCSFMIRELKFERVVFSLISSHVGGYTKWPILQDTELEKLRPFFGQSPVVESKILVKEALQTFRRVNVDKFFPQ